jgi:hypothetical protein
VKHDEDCLECGHSRYWHEQRREDEPSEFHIGICLCGCTSLKETADEHDAEANAPAGNWGSSDDE